MSKVVAIIPARSGSKRLEGKNKKLFCGKPLICWTIDEVLKCYFIDQIIVSTDDKEIIEICKQYKDIKVIERPMELAKDNTPMIEVIKHVSKELRYSIEVIILLQPTSPLRTCFDIGETFILYRQNKGCVVSVFKENDLHYKLNGAIYIDLCDVVLDNEEFNADLLYIMPKERSIDIDTQEDFNEAEKLMKERLKHESRRI